MVVSTSNLNIDNWAVDHEITAGESGSCSDWKGLPKIKFGISGSPGTRNDYLEDSWFSGSNYQGKPTDEENRRLDYYVCGNSELVGITGSDPDAKLGTGGGKADKYSGACKGLTKEQWNRLMDSKCLDANQGGRWKNLDECWNFVHTGLPSNQRPNGGWGIDDVDDESEIEERIYWDSSTNMWSTNDSLDPDEIKGSKLQGDPVNIQDWWHVWKSANDTVSKKELTGNSVIYPAYPSGTDSLELLGTLGHLPWDEYHALESAAGLGDEKSTYTCPSSHTREIQCHGDGQVKPGSDIPGCGMATEWSAFCEKRDEETVSSGQLNNDDHCDQDDYWGFGSGDNDHEYGAAYRFCARPHEQYDVLNLAECCIEGKGDPDPTNFDFKECPVDYCRTSLEYNTGIPSNKKCTTPITDDSIIGNSSTTHTAATASSGVCYTMNNKCNTLLENVCTNNVFNYVGPSLKKGKLKRLCMDWSKIQPSKINLDIICNLSDPASGKTILEEFQEEGTSENRKIELTNLINSPVCKDYLLTRSGGSGPALIQNILGGTNGICSLAVSGLTQSGSTNWIKTEFGNDPRIENICQCYYPVEYYQWYKENELPEDQKSNLGVKVSPECFHMGCRLSGFYPDTNDECPGDIQICKQEVVNEITTLGGEPGETIRVPGSSSTQACKFSNTNQETTSTSESESGGGSGGEIGSGGSNYNVERGTGTGVGTGLGMGMGVGTGTGTVDDDDDNTMLIIAIIVGLLSCCFVFLVIMIMMMKKKKANI